MQTWVWNYNKGYFLNTSTLFPLFLFFSLFLSLSLPYELSHFHLDITWLLSKWLSRSRSLKPLCVFLLFNVLGILLSGEERISCVDVVVVLKVHRPFFIYALCKRKLLYSPTCVGKTFVSSNAHTYVRAITISDLIAAYSFL